MSGFVPAGIGRRPVKHAIDGEAGNGPPGTPRPITEHTGDDERRKPDHRIADRRPVTPLHELLQTRAGDFASIPLGIGQPALLGEFAVASDKTVITPRNIYSHFVLLLPIVGRVIGLHGLRGRNRPGADRQLPPHEIRALIYETASLSPSSCANFIPLPAYG